jgi:hypothetical protein
MGNAKTKISLCLNKKSNRWICRGLEVWLHESISSELVEATLLPGVQSRVQMFPLILFYSCVDLLLL